MKQKKFIATPGITKKDREEVRVDGNMFFTNEKLRQKVITSVKKKLPKTQSTKIEKLINDKKIIPLFMTKSLWDYFRNRYEHENYRRGLRGFVHNKNKNVYLIMDSMAMRGGIFSDKLLTDVILHELVHVAFDNDTKKYLQINMPILTAYYRELFSIILDVPKKTESINVIQQIILVLAKQEKNRYTRFKELVSALDKLAKYSTLEEKEYDKKGEAYLDYIESHIHNKNLKNRRMFPEIHAALSKAFRNAYNTLDYDSAPDQRAYITSEVVATLAMVKPKSKFVTQTIMLVK